MRTCSVCGCTFEETSYHSCASSQQESSPYPSAGSLTVMADGHLGLSLGSALAIDLSDGGIGIGL